MASEVINGQIIFGMGKIPNDKCKVQQFKSGIFGKCAVGKQSLLVVETVNRELVA